MGICDGKRAMQKFENGIFFLFEHIAHLHIELTKKPRK